MTLPKLRHFILCKNIVTHDTYTYTAEGVYEYISAPEFPCQIDLNIMIGLFSAERRTEYLIGMEIYQNDTLLGGWRPAHYRLDTDDEVINVHFFADDFPFVAPGLIEFRITVDNELVDRQYVAIRQEVN